MHTGALAEVAKELGSHMEPYVGRLLPLLLRELRHNSAANRRNAAFAAGVLTQAAPDAVGPHLPSLLQALPPPTPLPCLSQHAFSLSVHLPGLSALI